MKIRFLALLSTILCFAASAFSQEPTVSMPSFSPEIKRIAVFKNGYAFTYREGEAQTSNGWAYTTNTPVGVLGTVWGYTTAPNARVIQLVASESDKKELKRVENLAQFLLANEGVRARFVAIYKGSKEGEMITKTIEGNYEIISPNGNYLISDKISNDPNAYNRLDQNQLSLIVKAETGALFLPVSQIQSVEILSPPKIEKPTLTKENRLALKVAGANADNVRLGIAALESGVQWIPAYRIEVKGEPINEAKLELEAVLVNNLADMSNAEVYFVVGVPHFLFQNSISPLSLNQTFAGVSANVSDGAGRGLSNAITTQVSAGDSAVSAGLTSPTVSGEEQAETFTAEQLFLYKTEGITLKKGERTSMRLFSVTIPCSEVFEWTIDDAAQPINYLSPDGQPIQIPAQTNRLWYSLRLKNTTGMPWTTAPALSFREWQPMGQDLLTFTPKGGENVLRVSPATEVIGAHNIEEKSRTAEQRKVNGRIVTFDVVTLEATIKISNYKKQPVEIRITRNLLGKVLEQTDGGSVKREAIRSQADNPNSFLDWTLTVPPGEKEIRYTYKVYVRK